LNRIFDAFVYSGEEELLIHRINELNSFVHFFVIAESNSTFSGKSRGLGLDFQKKVSSIYGDKIRWLNLENLMGQNAWEREGFQRQSLSLGFNDIQHGDIIMLSDVDEIPSHEYLQSLSNLHVDEILIAQMKLFRYCSHFESSEKWHGTISTRYVDKIPDMQALRLRAVKYWLEDDKSIYLNGGSHLTTFLSAKQYKQKIESFSHTELNTFPFKSSLFLLLIKKLGLTLDGNEILTLNSEFKNGSSYGECDSKHKFDCERRKVASIIQPVVKNLFLKKVKNLSTPV
jgi:hypothetical protein